MLQASVIQQLSLENLPIEILASIFSFILAKYHAFVVVLAQLSRRLRQLVVSTPLLWSTLSLSSAKDPRAKVQLWLSHNNGLLRGLYLRDYDENIREAISSLSHVSLAHLRAFSIIGLGRGRQLQLDLPLLTPTVISNLNFLSLGTADNDWLYGASNMQLQYLNIHVAIRKWNHLANQCTHLQQIVYCGPLTPNFASGIISLIRRNPNLRSIVLKCKRRPPGGITALSAVSVESPPIELAHLYTLVLRGSRLKTSYIISSLFLPNLRHLELEGLCGQWNDTIQSLITSKVVSRLRSLAIVYRYTYDPLEILPRSEAFIELLQHASQLQSLEFFRVSELKPVLRALAKTTPMQKSSDPSEIQTTLGVELCPQLSILDVSRCPDVNDELLMDIVKARNSKLQPQTQANSSNLHKLVINSCEKVTEEALLELKQRVPEVFCDNRWQKRFLQPARGTPSHSCLQFLVR